MFIDIACSQKKKYNQNAYGDYFSSDRFPSMNRVVAVLSDGLGSGIKANILACMTSTMLLKFIEAESDIKKACEIIQKAYYQTIKHLKRGVTENQIKNIQSGDRLKSPLCMIEIRTSGVPCI